LFLGDGRHHHGLEGDIHDHGLSIPDLVHDPLQIVHDTRL
jgi:hypothetical protein